MRSRGSASGPARWRGALAIVQIHPGYRPSCPSSLRKGAKSPYSGDRAWPRVPPLLVDSRVYPFPPFNREKYTQAGRDSP